MVGGASYVALTKTGNVGLVVVIGVLLGSWWMLAWAMG
jgi:hypothetical protein